MFKKSFKSAVVFGFIAISIATGANAGWSEVLEKATDFGKIIVDKLPGNSNKSAQAAPQSDRNVVGAYSRTQEYVIKAAAGGATIAVMGNCIKNIREGDDCFDKVGTAAAVGGALGATGGYIVAARQDGYESEAKALDKKFNSAQAELIAARKSRDAASRLVESHKQTINDLQSKKSLNATEKQKLSDQLALAREDIKLFESSKERLEIEIAALQKNINETSGQRAINQYAGVRDELKKERDEMQNLIDALNGITAQA